MEYTPQAAAMLPSWIDDCFQARAEQPADDLQGAVLSGDFLAVRDLYDSHKADVVAEALVQKAQVIGIEP